MKCILSKMKSPSAEKLFPEFCKLADSIENNEIVPELAEDTSSHTLLIQTTGNAMVATTTAPPNTMIPFTPRFPIVDSSILQVDKFNSSAKKTDELLGQAKKQRELVGEAVATFEMQHNAVIAAEIAQAEKTAKKKKIEDESELAAEIAQVEKTAKKRKIEEDSDHDSHQASELAKIKTIGICEAERDRQLKELITLYETDNNQEILQQLKYLAKQRLENTKKRLLSTTPPPPTT